MIQKVLSIRNEIKPNYYGFILTSSSESFIVQTKIKIQKEKKICLSSLTCSLKKQIFS